MAIVEPIETSGAPRKLRLRSTLDEQPIGEITVQTAEQVRAAVARARQAQVPWAAMGFEARAGVMWRALDHLLAHQEDFVKVIRRDTGRSRMETIMMEIFPACDTLAYHAKHAARLLADEHPSMHLLRLKKLVVTYKPLGVVGIITPWNGPFILSLNPTVQALMAGNAVLVKPSEVTPFASRLVAELFRAAGLPEGVLTILEGDGETGAALIESGVAKISFTGSVGTGRKVAEACARQLIPCTLELGGKDAAIVCADADLERAAGGAVFGGFMNTGQFCCSTERVYVVDSVADEFTKRVVDKVKALRLGTEGEYDIGPMIWPRQLEIVERHVEEARSRGASILTGGKRRPDVGPWFYDPTVLTDVTQDMLVMKDETFGPVLPIVRVRDEGEALRLANDSDYGLSGTVYTRDSKRGVALAKQMDTGSVSINDSSVTYGALEAPFGGRKASGVGQVNGPAGLKGYCFAQPIIVDRFQAKAEQVWYPHTDEKAAILQKVMRYVWGSRLGRLLA